MQESNQKNRDLRSSLVKYAGFLLSRRPYFSAQIRKKLTEKAIRSDQSNQVDLIEAIIEELEAAKYLNDDYLLAGYIQQKLNKLQGPKIIRLKLRQLGLKSEQITKALKNESLLEHVEHAKQKLVAKYPNLDSFQIKAKLYQRGF